MSTVCPECGRTFEQVGKHWRFKTNHRPELNDAQHNVVTGWLMGDATVDGKTNPRVTFYNTNRRFLEWTAEKLDWLATSVELKETPSDKAAEMRNSGFHPDATAENCRPSYQLRTVCHPGLEQYRSWYDTGKKVFPSVELAPQLVKAWYCTDGHLKWENGRGNACAGFTTTQGVGVLKRLKSSFESIGWSPRISSRKLDLLFSTSETKELLSWLEPPPDGMEYKWTVEDYQAYATAKTEVYSHHSQAGRDY